MSKVLDRFVISDLHLFHKSILVFARPEFDTLEEMHNTIIERWNAVIQPHNIVYILGDVTFHNKNGLAIIEALNGHKELVMGNHDEGNTAEYGRVFKRIHGARGFVLKDGSQCVMTHIPVHPAQVTYGYGRYKLNLHGHLHSGLVSKDSQGSRDFWTSQGNDPDLRYLNCCAEQLNYTPRLIGELVEERLKLL